MGVSSAEGKRNAAGPYKWVEPVVQSDWVCLFVDCELQIGGQGLRAAGTRCVEPLERWNPIALRDAPTGLPRRPRNRMIQSNLISLGADGHRRRQGRARIWRAS
jgi:hypothetical protein